MISLGIKSVENKIIGNQFIVNKRSKHHLQFSFGWPDDDVCNSGRTGLLVRMRSHDPKALCFATGRNQLVDTPPPPPSPVAYYKVHSF
jgi:hypothetical protein